MLAYDFQFGLRSFRCNPALTALIVMAIGLAEAALMTTYAAFRAVSGNPTPERFGQLFISEMDGWGPPPNLDGEPADALSFTDATSRPARRQMLLNRMAMSVLDVTQVARHRGTGTARLARVTGGGDTRGMKDE